MYLVYLKMLQIFHAVEVFITLLRDKSKYYYRYQKFQEVIFDQTSLVQRSNQKK